MRYPIVIRKDEGSSYGVAAPGLPGCFSGGNTLDAGGICALVDVDLSKLSAKPVQVNIVMPAPILAMVDKVAEWEGELRAGMLSRAMLCYVELLTLA